MEALDEGDLSGFARGVGSAEAVDIFELLEEQDGILDAVDAEFERIDVLRPHLDRGLVAGSVGLATAQREVGLGIVLRRGWQKRRKE